LFKLWRPKADLGARTALVLAADGCAIATTSGAGDRRRLLSCRSLAGNAAEQKKAVGEWLAGDRAEFGKLGTVLDAADYQLLLVESPAVLPAELKAAVRWRMKDLIDFPVEEAVVDVFNIPEPARRTGAKMMYAIAAKRDAIAEHVSLCRRGATGFDVVDIPELALRNLAARLPEAADGLILLWLNRGSAQLLVIKENTLYVARSVRFAGEGPNVEAVALELQRSMDYFESYYEQAPIAHLIVAPVDAAAHALAAALKNLTAMRIQTLDLSHVLDLPAADAVFDRRSLLAIGAALRDERPAL
jgi:MSHA biogenesis protein MshI